MIPTSRRIARACSDPQVLSVRDLAVYRHVPICKLCAFSLKDLTSVLHDLYQDPPPCREKDTETQAPTHSVHAMTMSDPPTIPLYAISSQYIPHCLPNHTQSHLIKTPHHPSPDLSPPTSFSPSKSSLPSSAAATLAARSYSATRPFPLRFSRRRPYLLSRRKM